MIILISLAQMQLLCITCNSIENEAVQASGPTALFYSGRWPGIAAFGYTAAKTRGAMASADWFIDFSDSEPEE